MANNYSESVEKIVNNYLNRLKALLKGFPEEDKEEMVKEINSHIYESYVDDNTEDEIERIFNVLDKLGEPAEAISSRIPDTMVRIGKRKKLPFYILAGILIGLFGLPLGLGGLGLLFGLAVTFGAFIMTFYIAGFAFVFGGWLGFIASILKIINPDILPEYIQIYDGLIADPVLGGIAGLISSVLLVFIGLGMLWLGKYLFRGLQYLGNLILDGIRSLSRKRQSMMKL